MQVDICAAEIWNDTGFRVESGKAYSFTCEGEWTDWFITCDANGYSRWWLKWAEPWRRVPTANWFRLIGAIDRDPATMFEMEESGQFTSTAAGQLTCFANDWLSKYGNNRGAIRLSIVPL